MPDVFNESSDLLKSADRDYRVLRRLLTGVLSSQGVSISLRRNYQELFATSELTYLLRLFAAFEAGFSLVGPILRVQCTFSSEATLGEKLDRIGSAMGMDPGFRNTVDRDLRELRNELMHGRSLIPRLSFEAVYELMRQFRLACH